MNPMFKRILTAAGYALAITYGSVQASGLPQSADGWIILAGVFGGAFWAKFSSNTTIIAANRAPWTEAERSKAALDELNKGL